MKRGRLPLTALRSFEVAGRLLSFTRAAEELFVSQAAISRQIRELEASIGRPLFERKHRAVVLTDDGASLLATLTDAFDRIDGRLSSLAAMPSSQSVTITVEPSFAVLWMAPNLADFRSSNPYIDVTIESDVRLVEFRSNEAVLAIRHGRSVNAWPRAEARHLADVEMVPVIAPSLLATGTPLIKPADIQQFELLHEENRRIWADWFRHAGAPEDSCDRGPVFADGGLVMQAALRGHGVGLCDNIFAQEEIAAGRLLRPFDIGLPFGAFYLVARNFKALPEPANALANWLLRRFRNPASEKTILAAVQQQ
jgi:LysR family transcriptional regulator, glycine cleavage system transcriptional activator